MNIGAASRFWGREYFSIPAKENPVSIISTVSNKIVLSM